MTEQEAQDLVREIQEIGYEAEIMEGYSGRGMYGQTTFAVIADGIPISVLTKYRSDQMGKGSIVLY